MTVAAWWAGFFVHGGLNTPGWRRRSSDTASSPRRRGGTRAGRASKPARPEQFCDGRVVGFRHRLEARVGAERAHLAAHVDHGFVERVAQRIAGIAADHEAAGLRHEGGEAADAAADDDVAALQRDAAAQRGIAFDDQQPPCAEAPGAGGGEPLTRTVPDIMFSADAGAGVAVHGDVGVLVHAAQRSSRHGRRPRSRSGASQPAAMVCAPSGLLMRTCRDAGLLPRRGAGSDSARAAALPPGRTAFTPSTSTSLRASARTPCAWRTPGRCASERNSEAIAT